MVLAFGIIVPVVTVVTPSGGLADGELGLAQLLAGGCQILADRAPSAGSAGTGFA